MKRVWIVQMLSVKKMSFLVSVHIHWKEMQRPKTFFLRVTAGVEGVFVGVA